jgi:hypothetical protein
MSTSGDHYSYVSSSLRHVRIRCTSVLVAIVFAVLPVASIAQQDIATCHEYRIGDELVQMGCFPKSFSSSSSSSSLSATSTTMLSTTTTLRPPTTTTTTTTTTTSSTSTTSTTIPLELQSCGDPIPDSASTSSGYAGLTTATDALYVLNAAVGLENCRNCICDINGNGAVTSTDALATLNLAVGIETPLMCPAC